MGFVDYILQARMIAVVVAGAQALVQERFSTVSMFISDGEEAVLLVSFDFSFSTENTNCELRGRRCG